MRARVFTKQLSELLKASVDDLTGEEKASLVKRIAETFLADRDLERFTVHFEPFVPGRRPDDEAGYPGLGSSAEVGLLHRGRGRGGSLKFLVRCSSRDRPLADFPPGVEILGTLDAIDQHGQAIGTLEGWKRRALGRLLRPVSRELPGQEASTLPRALMMELETRAVCHGAPASIGSEYLRFGRLFHQRYRIGLDVERNGTWIAGDEHEFEIHNEELYGSLYQRLVDVLLPHDTQLQASRRRIACPVPVSVHPWYPVLSIGMQKARLYMNAIIGDLVEQKRMLTNPGWLLRVGLYLEFLTCLGIAQTVKDEIDILLPEERDAFENSPHLAEIRKRIDVTAWRKVWGLREIAFSKPGSQAPTGVRNLLRKKSATLGFLHAHHEDLKHAIDLAGPNLHNAQETWHRVFRDAERAVLQMNRAAFPELEELPGLAREFALWHMKGGLIGRKLLPGQVTDLLGDQDGIFPAACRQYRASMNHIAAWAQKRGLMEYTGAECVPVTASLLESHLSGQGARLVRLQRRDGYAGSLDIVHEERAQEAVDLDRVVAILRGLDVFSVLSIEEIRQIAEGVRPITLGHLERILVQGRPGSSLFILQDGALEVIVRSDHTEKQAALLQPPAVIGELAFLLNEKRGATVRALDEATVLEIAAVRLRPLVEERPAILESLSALLEQRRRQNHEPEIRGGILRRLREAVLG